MDKLDVSAGLHDRERQYLVRINQEQKEVLENIPPDKRPEREQLINHTLSELESRLSKREDFKFGERQRAILKLKLTRSFAAPNEVRAPSINSLFDAIIETPKFINRDNTIGTLDELDQIHHQKTELSLRELQKRRAEIGEKGVSNPYENLFTTESGNYYMAKLLNRPHLETESEHMSHCVGVDRSGDSYSRKMRDQEIEILSFRSVPKINPDTGKLEGDTPVITIEYNLKTHIIEQIKKKNDKYLDPRDPYFDDFIDALKQLRTTKTVAGDFRAFTGISESELQNIPVADYTVLTENGPVPFREFDTKSGIFVLKTGKMTVTPEMEMPREDIAKIATIVLGTGYDHRNIAQDQKEVTGNTGLFLGSIEDALRFFPEDKLSSGEVLVYPSFPERRIRFKENELTKEEARKTIDDLEGDGNFVYDYAKEFIRSQDYQNNQYEGTVFSVECQLKDLGFEGPANWDQIMERAKSKGLGKLPPNFAPVYRKNYPDQQNYSYVIVAMETFLGADGDPRVFGVRRFGAAPLLNTSWVSPRGQFDPGSGFVFSFSK